VTVQVQRMYIVARVAEFQPVAATLVYIGFMVCIEMASPFNVH
jgi:hypothetical protein